MCDRFRRVSREAVRVAVALLLGVGAGAARAEDAVLLTSTAPGYSPGMVVATNERLSVPDGASTTLLFRSGEMLQLRGPFEGSLQPVETKAGGSKSVASLVDAFRLQGVDATVIGGTRALGVSPKRLTLDTDLMVDPRRSATYCIRPSTTVWISLAGGPGERIGLRRRGSLREVPGLAGAARVEWPMDVPIEDGDRFEIVDTAGAARATAAFRTVDKQPVSEAAWIAEAALLGCQEQINTALRELGRAAVRPELWLTTERGRQPTYRSAEPIRLTIQSNIDGHLYCVHRRGDDTVMPIFPAGAIDGARLRGHEPISLPGQRRPAELRAGPKGMGQIACYLADRDIGPELPHALVDPTAARLPDSLASRLDASFDGITGTRILKASLPLQVE
jgi:hypothetical protein